MYKFRDTNVININPQTVSGDLITLDNSEEMLQVDSLQVTLEPIQSGSGTPSPDNVRPISGRSEVDVIVSPTTSASEGNTYTTSLGQTVYGGTLDVVSGVLTVNRAMVDLGTFTWQKYGTYSDMDRYVSAGIDSTAKDSTTNAICSIYPYKWGANGFVIGNGSTKLSVLTEKGQYSSVADFKTAMNGVQLCYELATPTTVQLTPQEIELLTGTNHLWSGGEVTVTYRNVIPTKYIPTEAVSINGRYLEDIVDGYRTLYTKGRESLGAELDTYSVGVADGETFKSKRYPARTLTIGFQLIASTASEFVESFNQLNNILSLDEADFIFHDEEDKFFAGTPIFNASVEEGELSVKGEWGIYCAYPYKRSVEPVVLTMDDAEVTNTTASWAIEYNGARPSRPVLRVTFAGAREGGESSEDGDCGFVAFMDDEENIIQLGNPDVLDLDAYNKAETLCNRVFSSLTDWSTSGGHTWQNRAITGSISTSNTTDTYWANGKGQTQVYAKPSYGSGTGWHGAILHYTTTGAVNFEVDLVHRMCVYNAIERGTFECGLRDANGVMVAGFVIDKTANGTAGVVQYIVNNTIVGKDNIDLSYYNTHFGYCKRDPVYVTQAYQQKVAVKKKKKVKGKYVTKTTYKWVSKTRQVQSGWRYTQSNLNSTITKMEDKITFDVGNLPTRTYKVPAVEQMVATDISMYMGTNGTALNTNMVHSIVVRKEAGVAFAEQPNVFTAGDIVEADCNDATVYIYRDGSIGGHLEPQYGALGNNWESFQLTSGMNLIRATWSEWVDPDYKPQIEIEYNEVYI